MSTRTNSRGHSNAILNSVYTRSKTSVNAVPGKVSPATAQGVLPHYSGHATASLPTISGGPSLNRNQGVKLGDPTGNPHAASATSEKRVENRHPADRREIELSRRGLGHQVKTSRSMGTR